MGKALIIGCRRRSFRSNSQVLPEQRGHLRRSVLQAGPSPSVMR